MAEAPRPTVAARRVDEYCEALRKVLDARLGEGVEAEGEGQGRIAESACGLPPAPTVLDPTTGRPFDITMRMGPAGRFEFHPQTAEDLETAKELEAFVSGTAQARTGVEVARYLKRDKVLRPSLDSELDRLRTILEKEAPGQPGGILIDYHEKARVAEVLGYSSNPYKGAVWVLRLTPNYTVQNQAEIAEYVRRNEDAIAEAVRRLVPRKRRTTVAFYETHPGVGAAEFVRTREGYLEPEYHPENG